MTAGANGRIYVRSARTRLQQVDGLLQEHRMVGAAIQAGADGLVVRRRSRGMGALA